MIHLPAVFMRITIKLFALLRDRAGTSTVTLELPEGATARSAADELATRFPAIASNLTSAAYAVNLAYVPAGTVLKNGDELALIPPVSGG